MSMALIISIGAAILGAIAAAFGIGHSKGTAKAEKKADEQRTKEIIESEHAVAKRQTDTAKGASDVKDTVSRMPDSAVDDELRSDWLNKS